MISLHSKNNYLQSLKSVLLQEKKNASYYGNRQIQMCFGKKKWNYNKKKKYPDEINQTVNNFC